MNNMRLTVLYPGEWYCNGTWLLNVYVIQSNKNEVITAHEVHLVIEKYLLEIEQSYLSSEFEYFKTGFVFLHYGNRGIDLSIWHIGQWEHTKEMFNCSWYCYGRNVDNMELLDSAEPVLSQYEIRLLSEEICTCLELLGESKTKEGFREMYKEKWRKKEPCCIL